MRSPNWLNLLVAAVALALVAAACGSDDSTDAASDSASASASASESESASASEPAETDEPNAEAVAISHKFGDVAISGTPERVITLGYSEQDPVLALGVTPVAVREWFGGFDHATWPWAQDELGAGTPTVLDMPFGELNYETIAGLEPDLIVATHAGITQEEYDILADIAPTIAESADVPAFGMAWQDQTRMIGEALGLADEADQAVAVTEAAVLDAARANEALDGATFAWANPTGTGTYWVVGSNTPPMRFLQDLGLVYPDEVADVVGDADSLELSSEQIGLLDVDVLIVQADAEVRAGMEADPLWQATSVMGENRILWLEIDDPIYGALSFSTVLSIDFMADELAPLLDATISGGAASDADVDPESQAAIDAFVAVYDSSADWATKAPHLEDADALEASNEAYREGGDGLGGIRLEATAAEISGDVATITYDVIFGENAAYNDLSREITLIDGTWVVSRDDYCDFLATARTPCQG
ncbi:MAG: iron-siderophore ABC transporter substrate-binding protein [Actinomycetota bacterium]